MNEPVMWWDGKDLIFKEKHFDQLIPLYTHPVKELTDEEIWELHNNHQGLNRVIDFAKALLLEVQNKC